MKHLRDIIFKLVQLSSPSGYETEINNYINDYLSQYKDIEVKEDNLGNTYAIKKGATNNTTMLVAHCDEIGFAVKYIDDSGYIRFTPIGGVDLSILNGLRVTIKHAENIVNGVIGARPIHLSRNERSNKGPMVSDLWIDIGAKDKEQANEYVSVGDPITFKPVYSDLLNNVFTSKSIDNRVGVAILLECITSLYNVKTNNNIIFVFTVQEELGLRGATTAGYQINPDVCIAIDVTHATDYPTLDKNYCGDIRLGMGPVIPIGANFNNGIQNRLKQIADINHINYQLEAIPGYSGTDVSEVQTARGGIKTGLISVPCRYMHTPVEIASYTDISSAVDILVKYCLN